MADALRFSLFKEIFHGVFPSIKQLKQGSRARHSRENAIYKLVIDILGLYYRMYDGPGKKVSPTPLTSSPPGV